MYPYIRYNMYRKVMFLHAPTPRRCGHVAEWAIGVAVQPTKLAYCFSNMLHFQISNISNISNDFSFLRLSFYVKGSHHLQGSERSLHNVVRSQGNTQHISYRRERFPLSHRLRNTQNIQLLDLIRFILRIHSTSSESFVKMTLEC